VWGRVGGWEGTSVALRVCRRGCGGRGPSVGVSRAAGDVQIGSKAEGKGSRGPSLGGAALQM
jgi:hypothetical protein